MNSGPITDAQAERFKRLAWPLMPIVLRTAQCLTRRTDQAEDLAQETMVKAMRAMDSYQNNTNVRAWLLTILRRSHIDRMRAQHARPTELPLDEAKTAWLADESEPAGYFDDQWDQPEALMNRFEDQVVIEAMRNLPEGLRWTLLLVDVERMEQTDAAAVLGVAVGTIKSRTHRGRAMLRDQLYQFAAQRGWVRAPARSS